MLRPAFLVVSALAASAVLAQSGAVLMPPLSRHRAEYFKAHPEEYQAFLATLPPRPPTLPEQAAAAGPAPAFGGTWQSKTTSFYVGNPLLLTDGTVIAHVGNSATWYKLTPDQTGSYVNGSWTQIASLPTINGTQYAPLYFTSAVLPDGRVLIMGGEYNNGSEVFSNLGAIYDPVANTWTAVSAPKGSSWSSIGDAASTVLANGTLLLSSCCANPSVDALFNASTLGWTSTGAPNGPGSQDYQDEQGYELLPNGDVLTLDIWGNYPNGNVSTAELYVPSSGTWVATGSTPVSLADPAACKNWEIGPAVVRPDGTVVAFGGNTGCVAGATADPTAIYDSTAGTWKAGPNVPGVCGSGGSTSCDLADAPAALLPNGNILFAASSGYGDSPTHMFEYTTSNTIQQVSDPVYCSATLGAYVYDFLVLPTGQVLSLDGCNAPEFYTPSGAPQAGWAPVITSVPSALAPGATYTISGTQFSGLSQGAYFGDDVQAATNYPLVRITNASTGHVTYARTFGQTSRSIAPGAASSTQFTVPATIELGAASLVVVANGIASAPQSVSVATATISVSPSSLNFGNQAVKTKSAAKTVAVTNLSASVLSISSIANVGGTPTSFPEASNCGASLAAGASCTVSVAFAPGGTGLRDSTLTLTDSAGTQTVALSGTGVAATLGVSPSSLTFPAQVQKTRSAPQTVTVTNAGSAAVSISSIANVGGTPTSFPETNNCGTSLAAGASCAVSVVFSPGGVGNRYTTLTLTDGAGTQTVALSGTGVSQSAVLSPSSLIFPATPVGTTSAAQTVTLTNSAASALAISSVANVGGSTTAFYLTNGCGASLAAGASCTIGVKFHPGGTGLRTTTLTVTDGDGTQTVALSGNGS